MKTGKLIKLPASISAEDDPFPMAGIEFIEVLRKSFSWTDTDEGLYCVGACNGHDELEWVLSSDYEFRPAGRKDGDSLKSILFTEANIELALRMVIYGAWSDKTHYMSLYKTAPHEMGLAIREVLRFQISEPDRIIGPILFQDTTLSFDLFQWIERFEYERKAPIWSINPRDNRHDANQPASV